MSELEIASRRILGLLGSRRTFVKTVATFCAMPLARTGSSATSNTLPTGRILAYVGTDTLPVDGAANGKGIYLYEMHPVSGKLSLIKLAAETVSPSWLTLHPSGRYLYAINETSDFEGKQGSVSSFAVDRASGNLKSINVVGSGGAGPAHMSVDASGRWAYVANYSSGTISVFPILANGALGPASFTHSDEGSLGDLRAANAPPGSFAISGHDGPHAHMIASDAGGQFVLQTDLAQDRIYVYKLNPRDGTLVPAAIPYVSLPSGDGPRHFAFHPSGEWMYSIQEEASTVVCYTYDTSTGSLRPVQTISTLPRGFTGTNFCSEILISPNGRTLYAANRLHNSIATFVIGRDGRLTRLGETLTQGDYPNHISLDPSGRFLYACNQRSDQITSFHVSEKTGSLTFTGQYTPLGTPMCIVFLK